MSEITATRAWRLIGFVLAIGSGLAAIALYRAESSHLVWASAGFILGMLLVGILVRVEHGFWPLD